MKRSRTLLMLLLSVLLLGNVGHAGDGMPDRLTKCQVCGMFVAKYPDWLASINLADGSQVWFDGPKDMFRYYFNPATYSYGQTKSQIQSAWVTEYYELRPVDVKEVYYVLGSEVYGPMGRELVPFASQAAAEEFMKDHHGKRILRFIDITQDIVEELL